MHLEVLVHQLNGFLISSARHNTTYSRQQCSYCQRSCPGSTLLRYHVCRVSAPCDCCIELCTGATHGLPADRAPAYRGCPDRDPLGCPLIPRQDGIRDKAPTLCLLQLLRLMQLLQLLHACARAINIGHAFTNTEPSEYQSKMVLERPKEPENIVTRYRKNHFWNFNKKVNDWLHGALSQKALLDPVLRDDDSTDKSSRWNFGQLFHHLRLSECNT